MKIKFIKTGRTFNVTPAKWDKLKAIGKEGLYEVLGQEKVVVQEEPKAKRRRKPTINIEDILVEQKTDDTLVYTIEVLTTKTEDGEIQEFCGQGNGDDR